MKHVALTSSIAVKVVVLYFLHTLFIQRPVPETYTYKGDDYPLKWNVSTLPPVRMRFHDSRHLVTERNEISDAEWEAQTPGKGLIYLGEDDQPYSISMMHEIRCLDVLRREINHMREDESPSPRPGQLALHCLNYVRQMVMCRANTNAETRYHAPVGAQTSIVYQCNDWTKVYDAIDANQEAHSKKHQA